VFGAEFPRSVVLEVGGISRLEAILTGKWMEKPTEAISSENNTNGAKILNH